MGAKNNNPVIGISNPQPSKTYWSNARHFSDDELETIEKTCKENIGFRVKFHPEKILQHAKGIIDLNAPPAA